MDRKDYTKYFVLEGLFSYFKGLFIVIFPLRQDVANILEKWIKIKVF